MFKVLALTLALMTNAYAGEILINTVDRSEAGFYDHYQTEFFTVSDEAFVAVKFMRMVENCTRTAPGHEVCAPNRDVVGSVSSKIEGLSLVENKFIFSSAEGDVVCATKKRGLFGMRTVLTGRCQMVAKRAGRQLNLYFVTK